MAVAAKRECNVHGKKHRVSCLIYADSLYDKMHSFHAQQLLHRRTAIFLSASSRSFLYFFIASRMQLDLLLAAAAV